MINALLFSQSRLLVHFAIAAVLYGLYGGQVCPFLAGLLLWQLLLPLLAGFAFILLIRAWLKQTCFILFKVQHRIFVQFSSDCLLFLLVGIAIAGFNGAWYGAPWISGFKVVLALLSLGFYIACDLGLHYERVAAQDLIAKGRALQPDEPPFSLTRKFVVFSVLSIFFYAVIIFLIVNKDLDWLLNDAQAVQPNQAWQYILLEVAFVSLVLLSYLLLVIISFAKNLALLFDFQNSTLKEVSLGCLDVSVPVVSNDEFGLMAVQTNKMIHSLKQKSAEVLYTREVAIVGLAALAEARDNETGAHIIRTQHYVRILADYLSKDPVFSVFLTSQVIDLMYKSAPLHDIGKVGIPDAILLKPGQLSEQEVEVMKQHPKIGFDALLQAEHQNKFGGKGERISEDSFLHFAREIALTHHEHWDGSGYPNGLSGEQIPLSGRLMALADVYDALISKRVYKPAFSHQQAKANILQGRGQHFDPQVVDAFIACEQKFVVIANKYAE